MNYWQKYFNILTIIPAGTNAEEMHPMPPITMKANISHLLPTMSSSAIATSSPGTSTAAAMKKLMYGSPYRFTVFKLKP